MSLHLASDLTLPVRTVTEKLGFLGTTGSGKTYAASKLAELFWAEGAQFIVLDPVGVWYGLRLQADGKHPSSITIPIFGGLHGDVPLEPTGGALVANLIVDRGLSVIVDVSQFEYDTQKVQFAKAFADRLFFRKKAAPSAVHVFMEECQEFVPQNPQKGEEGMLHAFTRMQKLGRNFGIGSSYISQRPQEVNKKALNLAQTLFVFRTTGLHERKAIEGWIQDKGLDQDIVADLPKLATGTCHVWSPEFLKVSKVVTIVKKETCNASATPQVGAKSHDRELVPIDLDKIRAEMASTIEKAKAEDPKALRDQIAKLNYRILELQREFNHKPVPDDTQKIKEVPVLKGKQLAQLESFCTKLMREAERHGSAMSIFWSNLNQVAESLLKAIKSTVHERPTPTIGTSAVRPPTPHTQVEIHKISHEAKEGAAVSRSQQRILNALVWAEGIMLRQIDKTQLALMSDQRPTSGGYFNNLGALRSAGLITYPMAGMVTLTDAGRVQAEAGDVPTTSEELQQMLFAKLPASQTRILRVLIKCYPGTMSKDRLAEESEQRSTSGGYFNNLGRLRSLGLIEYPSPGQVVAQPVLFLDSGMSGVGTVREHL